MPNLFVFFTASPRAAHWRAAISQAGVAGGWRVVEDDGLLTSEEAFDTTAPMLVLSSLATPSFLSGDWLSVVVHDTPAAAMALAVDGSRRAMSDAAYQASGLYAVASELASGGALMLDARAASLHLPELGVIEHEAVCSVPADTWRALGVYEQLPPPVGASTGWPLAALNYLVPTPQGPIETGEPRIDLTGRARNLIYGPYTVLPAGTWQLNAQVMIDPEGGAAHLVLDWGSNIEHASMQSTVVNSGVYGLTLQHAWLAPAAAEFRVSTTQPHFHGRIELLSLNVRRIADEPQSESVAEGQKNPQ